MTFAPAAVPGGRHGGAAGFVGRAQVVGQGRGGGGAIAADAI
ncbi:MAG: hypothetical protein U9N09_01765 [Euryarchaeota archaeon]|nr:hypothetical protein [Euryarchaeota archaeon]